MSNLNEKLKCDNSNIPKPPRTVIQVDNIPAELKAIPQWTLWKYIWKEKSWAKVPWTFYNTVAKWKSEAEDCRHPFDDVLRQFLRNNNTDGIGIFIEDTGFVGIDLDNKFGKPTIDTHVDIVSLFDSYTENTTHTEGLRILVKADASDVPESMYTSKIELPNGFGYEWYSKGRFFTVTGRHVSGSPKTINSRQVELEQFLGTYMERKNPLKTASEASTTLPPNLEVAERLDQLQAYLDACPGAIEGRNASNYCYAVVLTSLWGFDLVDYRDLVEERLIKWGERSDQSNVHGAYNPWTPNEIRHKIESALEATYNGVIGDKLHKVELLDLPEGTIIEELAKPDKKTVSTEIVDPCFEADTKKETLPSTPQFFYAADAWNMPPSKPLIKRHLNKGTLTFVAGDSGTGKSFYVIDMALSIATGNDFLGKYKTYGNGRPVVYLCGEGSDGVKKRICAWMQHNETSTRNMITLPFRFNFLDENDIERIISQIDLAFPNNPPALIIGDTLSKMYLGEENNGKDPKIVMSNAERLIKHYDCSFLFVHHHGKDASKGMRGFSGFQCDADNVIVLEKSEIIDPESQITSKVINTKAKDEGRLEDYYVNFKKVELQHPETSLPILDDDLIPLDSLVAEISGLSNRDYRQQEIENKLVAELKPFSDQLTEEPKSVTQILKKLLENDIDISEKTVRRKLTELVKIGFANKTDDSPIRFYLNKSY